MKKWFRKWTWRLCRWWYRVRIWFGWWYCEHCERMHSPFKSRYDFYNADQDECCQGVYDIPVPKAYEGDTDYFYSLVKSLHRVG